MYRTATALVALSAVLLLAGSGTLSSQQTCSQSTVRAIVDETGRVLRHVHEEAKPRLDAGFLALKKRRGWSDADYQEKAAELLADDKMEALDAKAGDLLARFDRLADTASGNEADCARLGEVEATALELQAAVRSKLRHMLARLDAAVGEAPIAAAPVTPPTAVPPSATKQPPSAPQPPAVASPARPAAPDKQAAVALPPPPAVKQPNSSWQTSTSEERMPIPPPPSAQAAPPAPIPKNPRVGEPEGLSIDEIREASRGLFGTLSSELAGVIEYAFASSGRPTGYILGNEGGGAFIAGVRYGKGTLFTRGGQSREVYWHGPSIGYDFGASGSKTLFLVYGLGEPLEIFSGFSGVDGSAYLIGGVGMTVLTDGRLFLAPIRTGLGLRIGASIGYVRFTPRPTWNPF